MTSDIRLICFEIFLYYTIQTPFHNSTPLHSTPLSFLRHTKNISPRLCIVMNDKRYLLTRIGLWHLFNSTIQIPLHDYNALSFLPHAREGVGRERERERERDTSLKFTVCLKTRQRKKRQTDRQKKKRDRESERQPRIERTKQRDRHSEK